MSSERDERYTLEDDHMDPENHCVRRGQSSSRGPLSGSILVFGSVSNDLLVERSCM